MEAYFQVNDDATIAGFREMILNIVYAIDDDDNGGLIEEDAKILDKRIYFSTIFKAKGLGAANVWWITKDLDLERPTDALTSVKRNMYYVALTRTIEKMTFLGRRPFS